MASSYREKLNEKTVIDLPGMGISRVNGNAPFFLFT